MAYYRKLVEGWRLSDGILNECFLAEPCDVVKALREAGCTPDPEKGMNALDCEWISLRRWTYSTTFDAPSEDDERALLEFGRVFGRGSLFLNGEELGTFESGAFRFDLTGVLRQGSNALSVRFVSAPHVRPEQTSPMPKIGLAEAPVLRTVNFATVEHVGLTSRLSEKTGLIECSVDLTAHISGKYRFRYVVSLDGEAILLQDFEEKLPAARRVLTHTLRLELPVTLDRNRQDETVYQVKLTIERGGVGCDAYRMETAFRSSGGAQRCLAVLEWPVSAETAERLITLNADGVFPVNAPSRALVDNDFYHGLTVLREGEDVSEVGMLSESSMKRYAAGEMYWPNDGTVWKLRGGKMIDGVTARALFGAGVSMGAAQFARLVRYLQATRLADKLHMLRRQGKRAVVPADEDFAYFASDALIEKDGSFRPAAYAVREAWKERRVFSETPESARPGERLNVPVWVADEARSGEALSVRVRALTAEGEELADASTTAMSGGVRQARILPINLPAQEGIIIVRAEMKDMDGTPIDRFDRVLCVSSDVPMKALCTLSETKLKMERGMVRNVGSTIAISAWQCLLPGEESAQSPDEWLNA